MNAAAPRIVPTVARFIPQAVLRKRDEGIEGYYVAAAGITTGWRGAAVMHSLDGGQSWKGVATLRRESVMGRVIEADGGSVTLRLLHAGMTLESRSQADVKAGANRLLLGREIIAFEQARLVAPCTWALSEITRQRKSTAPDLCWAAGQSAVLLNENNLARVDIKTSAAAQGLYITASVNQRIIDEPGVTFNDMCL